jgi:hypothetical protein
MYQFLLVYSSLFGVPFIYFLSSEGLLKRPQSPQWSMGSLFSCCIVPYIFMAVIVYFFFWLFDLILSSIFVPIIPHWQHPKNKKSITCMGNGITYFCCILLLMGHCFVLNLIHFGAIFYYYYNILGLLFFLCVILISLCLKIIKLNSLFLFIIFMCF